VGPVFFEGPDNKPRLNVKPAGTQSDISTLRLFAEQELELEDTAILTINDCLARLGEFAKCLGRTLPAPSDIKTGIQTIIRELHDKGLRNDLILEDGRSARGWKGIRLKTSSQRCTDRENELTKVRESGLSEESEMMLST